MKKIIFAIIIACFAVSSVFAQLISEQNVTATMELQPVLQLNMTTPDQINFVFDNIPAYYGGIIKYGATILKVSSSVSWDLYAVGTSNNGTNWDLQQEYNNTGAANGRTTVLPLTALELHQNSPNVYDTTAGVALYPDYNIAFNNAVADDTLPGKHSIYASPSPYTAPDATTGKYIQGQKGVSAGQSAPGGSYLSQGGTTSQYYFAIDYRIIPGLPARFPAAGDATGTSQALTGVHYAAPGTYTMNVKYVLLEDQ